MSDSSGTLVNAVNDDRGNWLCTFGNTHFHLIDPSLDEVHIDDIAHSLANMCRWAGHVRDFYSVAQHCVLGSFQVPEEDAFAFLMHDSTEAYVVDIPRPMKYLSEMSAYLEIEDRVYQVIAKKFGLPLELPQSVKVADNRMLLTEQRDLRSNTELLNDMMAKCGLTPYEFIIDPWSPYVAKQNFLLRFNQLYGKR